MTIGFHRCILAGNEKVTHFGCHSQPHVCLYPFLFINSYQVEAKRPRPSPTPTPTPTPTPNPGSVTKKVFVLNFDPYISGTTPLTTYKNWSNPNTLNTTHVSDLKSVSHNVVNYQIVSTQVVRDYPVKKSGFKFTNTQYLGCLTNSSPTYCGELIDYQKLVDTYNLCTRAVNGEFDEVWLWGGPWFGYWEWTYAGPNSPAYIPQDAYCSKRVAIMGFNYERTAVEMLHNVGHRIESHVTNIYGNYPYNNQYVSSNPWSRFTAYNQIASGQAGCGNIHFPPNGTSHYDYSNTNSVTSSCNDWLNYPTMTGVTETISCSAWGCSQYGFLKYWMTRLPYKTGKVDGKLNNWWLYTVDYDRAVSGYY